MDDAIPVIPEGVSNKIEEFSELRDCRSRLKRHTNVDRDPETPRLLLELPRTWRERHVQPTLQESSRHANDLCR